MSKYIKAEDLIFEIDKTPTTIGFLSVDYIKEMIDGLPSKVVPPVKHGRWIVIQDHGDCICNVCAAFYKDNGQTIPDNWKYCPNCGARMDENDE